MPTDYQLSDNNTIVPSSIASALIRIHEKITWYFNLNDPSHNNKWQIKYGGFVIAALGFVLTRIAILPFLHLNVSFGQFIIGQVIPLTLGLGIVVLGVSLAVSTLTRPYVNIIAVWCVLTASGMGAVSGFIVLQVSLYTSFPSTGSIWLHSLFTNTLLAGALSGILIGIRSADNQQHRHELTRQSGQLTLLNRLLRHEILNKITIIQGYANQLTTGANEDDYESTQAISRSADHIEATIEDVGFLTRIQSRNDSSFGSIDIMDVIEQQVQTAQERYPNAVFTINESSSLSDDSSVRADTHLHTVIKELLENAVEHNTSSTPRITIGVDLRNTHIEISITDNGPGLPDGQRDILERGVLPTHDDPSTGFGLSLTRMLLLQYGGTITVTDAQTDVSGTTIKFTLPQATNGEQRNLSSQVQAGITPQQIGSAILAALIAGSLMGVVLQGLSNTIPAIGGLYGVQSFGIGWVLHLFHSVIFGIFFSVILSRLRLRQYTETIRQSTAIGLGYGLILWIVAAGIVMPVWLNAVGLSVAIPRLTISSLIGHMTWGISVGALYGYLSE